MYHNYVLVMLIVYVISLDVQWHYQICITYTILLFMYIVIIVILVEMCTFHWCRCAYVNRHVFFLFTVKESPLQGCATPYKRLNSMDKISFLILTKLFVMDSYTLSAFINKQCIINKTTKRTIKWHCALTHLHLPFMRK